MKQREIQTACVSEANQFISFTHNRVPVAAAMVRSLHNKLVSTRASLLSLHCCADNKQYTILV